MLALSVPAAPYEGGEHNTYSIVTAKTAHSIVTAKTRLPRCCLLVGCQIDLYRAVSYSEIRRKHASQLVFISKIQLQIK